MREILTIDKKAVLRQLGRMIPDRNAVGKKRFNIIKCKTQNNRVFVKGEGTWDKWVIGFPSYDGRGYVFWNERLHKWEFTGIVTDEREVRSKKLNGYSSRGYKTLPFEMKLQKGINEEKKIVEDLSTVFKEPYHVIRLPRSGLKCHGSDIVISFFSWDEISEWHRKNYPFKYVVRNSIVAIEVLGIRMRGKHKHIPCFSYRYDKDFKWYMEELQQWDILPVIAWNYDGESHYMILDKYSLDKVFYYTNKDGERKPITGYAHVRDADLFRMNNNQFQRVVETFLDENERFNSNFEQI